MTRSRLLLTFFLFVAGAAAIAPSSALAGSGPWARIVPARVHMGSNVTVLGGRFPSHATVDFVLVQSHVKSPWKQFIPKFGKADSHGNLKATFRMPIVPFCGAATIFAARIGSPTGAQAQFTLTGCRAHGSVPPPPPPPGKKKKH